MAFRMHRPPKTAINPRANRISLQERRRIEEAYVQGLKKLGSKHAQVASAELG